jgi:hypothetical protein
VCGLRHAQGDEEREFLGSASTKVYGFSQFGLKTGGYGSCGLALKPLTRVFWFGPQNWQLRSGDLAHKITATVSWFILKTKWAMICGLRHKTDGRMKMAWGTRRYLAAFFA